MTISPEDVKLFYRLFLSLLDDINDREKIIPLKNMANTQGMDPAEVFKVSDFLWKHIDCIDQYLASETAKELSDTDREILLGWKHFVRGNFLCLKHLKTGSIFVDTNSDKFYRVLGLTCPWNEVYGGASLPILTETTFIPFKGSLISDGLFRSLPLHFGRDVREMFLNLYKEAKQKGQIITSL